MSANDTFERAKAEKFQKIKDALTQITDVFAVPSDMNQRRNAAQYLYEQCNSLSQILNSQDRPNWLQNLQTSSRRFYDDPHDENARRMQRALIANNADISPLFSEEVLSFDKYFEQLHEEESVANRFDSLATEMQKLIDNEEVPDIAAIKTLEKMIAALKANRKGSYWSTLFTTKFVLKGWAVVMAIATLANQVTSTMKNIDSLVQENDTKVEEIRHSIEGKALAAIKDVSPRTRMLVEQQPAGQQRITER